MLRSFAFAAPSLVAGLRVVPRGVTYSRGAMYSGVAAYGIAAASAGQRTSAGEVDGRASAAVGAAAAVAAAAQGFAERAKMPWRLYVIPGSQFAAKVLLGLDTQGVAYETYHVSATSRGSREKQLPAGGFLVPQVEVPGEDGAYAPLKESTAILRAVDEFPHDAPGKLYPSEEVAGADARVSKVMNAYVLYFNHVSRDGWTKSIRAAAVNILPLGGVLGRVLPLYVMYSPIRNSMRDVVMKGLEVGEDALVDERMETALIEELETYESALDGKHDYLFGFEYPTAADCALHAMVSRFVHGMGDSGLPGALPTLFETAGPKLERVRAWHQRMTDRYPMKWTRNLRPLKN